MYLIKKQFEFSASHVLQGLAENHPCSRLHGHNYKVTICLISRVVNDIGMVKDYREMESIKQFLNESFDHKHLNDVVTFNPTAENLAYHLYKIFKPVLQDLSSVSVKETDKTEAIYYESW